MATYGSSAKLEALIPQTDWGFARSAVPPEATVNRKRGTASDQVHPKGPQLGRLSDRPLLATAFDDANGRSWALADTIIGRRPTQEK